MIALSLSFSKRARIRSDDSPQPAVLILIQ